MTRRTKGIALAAGLLLVAVVLLVAVYLPGENVTRALAVVGCLATLGKAGYDVWDKERERKKKETAANSPIEFKARDVFFGYGGRDEFGGGAQVTKSKGEYVTYRFKLDAFNTRAENVGLTNVWLHFGKDGQLVHQQRPRDYANQTLHGATLPTKEWISISFSGDVDVAALPAVSECDEIYLSAESISGEQFRIPLATCIIEQGGLAA